MHKTLNLEELIASKQLEKLKNINEPNIRDIDGYDQIPLIKDSFMMRIFS